MVFRRVARRENRAWGRRLFISVFLSREEGWTRRRGKRVLDMLCSAILFVCRLIAFERCKEEGWGDGGWFGANMSGAGLD